MGAPSSSFTKFKIILGSLLLILFLFFSVDFIQQEVDKLSDSDSEQENKTDSLLLLLREKDRNTIEMLRTLNEANQNLLSVNDIEDLILRQQDSIVITQQVVQYRVVEKKDSVLNPTPKKKFFKRLAEAFVPAKDTTVLLNTSVEYSTDTIVHEYNPMDSLQKKLQVINEQKMERYEAIQKNNARLRYLNRQLTTRIDSMIKRAETESLLHSRQEAEHQQNLRLESIRKLGGIAIGAIVFAVFLLFLIWRDIVQSNRYRRELEEANRRAEELLEAREKLMLAITHDFKAPLGSIMGYADLLSRLLEDERKKFYMSNIKSSSEHLLKLVNDLLEFHRLDLNKEVVERVTFKPSQLFDEVKNSFEPLADSKGLALQYECDEELKGRFVGDPLRIRQIVNNLLSNAIKFTADGNVGLKVSYANSQLTLSVSDTGKGIPPEDKERIFQEFTRLAGAQGADGFGLGLSIVSKLVQLLEGRVEVESIEGEGTAFHVYLPLYPVGGMEEEEEIVSSEEESELLNTRLKVLIIDDDKIQLTLTAAMLEQKNMSVICCEQLEELIEHLRYGEFDILLTDIQMPAINGFDLLQLLRASTIPQMNTIPVIAVTARSEMSEEELRKIGFAGCLHKPFSIKDLMKVLNHIYCSDDTEAELEEEEYTVSELNFKALTAFTEDDQEAAHNIIKTFISETEKSLEGLEVALKDENAEEIGRISHKLLPVFTLLNTTETVTYLRSLEKDQHLAFSDDIKERTEKVIEEIHKIVVRIRKEYGLDSSI